MYFALVLTRYGFSVTDEVAPYGFTFDTRFSLLQCAVTVLIYINTMCLFHTDLLLAYFFPSLQIAVFVIQIHTFVT